MVNIHLFFCTISITSHWKRASFTQTSHLWFAPNKIRSEEDSLPTDLAIRFRILYLATEIAKIIA